MRGGEDSLRSHRSRDRGNARFAERLTDQEKFLVHIDQRFPLAEAAKALELSHQGHTGGKIILEVSR